MTIIPKVLIIILKIAPKIFKVDKSSIPCIRYSKQKKNGTYFFNFFINYSAIKVKALATVQAIQSGIPARLQAW